MYEDIFPLHILFIIIFVVTLFVIPLGLSTLLKKEHKSISYYIGFIVTAIVYFSFSMHGRTEVTPTDIEESEYGVFVLYKDTPAYFTDTYVKKFHSDSTKVQYYYNEEWYPFFNEEQYLTYERKDVQAR